MILIKVPSGLLDNPNNKLHGIKTSEDSKNKTFKAFYMQSVIGLVICLTLMNNLFFFHTTFVEWNLW